MPHPVMYFEIGCRGVAATRDFYKSLFDWVPTVDIGEGKFAWIQDNGGNTVGLWQPSK